MTSTDLVTILDILACSERLDLADTLLTTLDGAGILPPLPPDDAGPAALVGGTPALAVAA